MHVEWIATGGLAFLAVVAGIQWVRRDTATAPTIRAMAAGAALALVYRSLQLTGVLVPLWFAAAVVHYDNELAVAVTATLVLFFAGGGLFYATSDATSLHHFYATRVASCFGTLHQWDPSLSPAEMLEVQLSSLRRAHAAEGERPELLICAAANIKAAKTPVASMVFSPEEVRLHTAAGTSALPTADYERFTYPSRGEPGDQRSALTLFRAVGLSGAALSPSMGFTTVRAARGVLALVNARLGRWMPNPADPGMRDLSLEPGNHPLHPGGKEALRELWGHHPDASELVYVTDGGHYENLGLVELLRRRCELAIVIDSSGGRPGTSRALEHSIAVATRELDVDIDLAVQRFHRSDGRPPEIQRCWALGSVTYRDETRADLLVIRIGIDSDTPEHVVRGGRVAKRFPYTSTLDQRYDADKFNAYVALGRSSTCAALGAPEVVQVFSKWRARS